GGGRGGGGGGGGRGGGGVARRLRGGDVRVVAGGVGGTDRARILRADPQRRLAVGVRVTGGGPAGTPGLGLGEYDGARIHEGLQQTAGVELRQLELAGDGVHGAPTVDGHQQLPALPVDGDLRLA